MFLKWEFFTAKETCYITNEHLGLLRARSHSEALVDTSWASRDPANSLQFTILQTICMLFSREGKSFFISRLLNALLITRPGLAFFSIEGGQTICQIGAAAAIKRQLAASAEPHLPRLLTLHSEKALRDSAQL